MRFLGFKVLMPLAGIALVQLSACGSSDGTGSATSAISCSAAAQKLPAAPICDANRVCRGQPVPSDQEACNQCGQAAQQLGMKIDSLTNCACNHCAVQLGACFQSATRETNGDPNRDTQCRTVVECALSTGCAGTDCYCGKGVVLADCLQKPAQGPCAQQIATAAGCASVTDAVCVATAQANADSAVGRAFAVGQCTTGESSGAVGNCPPTM
jgi:hypothetical protein